MADPPPPGAEDDEPLPPGAEGSNEAHGGQGYASAGYDPNAAGYDYSAYWAQYGYQQAAYYPGYYAGYEGYDPAAYAAYTAQQAAATSQPPDASQAATSAPADTPAGDAAPGSGPEDAQAEAVNGLEDPSKADERIKASKAEEEERQRAEEERVKAAQAAAEEATRAAAEEAARQAEEQRRVSEEAAVRARNLAAARAQAAEQPATGPTPDVLERIQRELAEAQEVAAKKKAAEEEAAAEAAKKAAAAAAAAAAPLQGASKKRPQNIMLKGAKMAFSAAAPTSLPTTRATLSKVFAEPSDSDQMDLDPSPVIEKQKSIDRAGKLYLPEPLARANRTDYRPQQAPGSRRGSGSRSPLSSRSRSPSRGRSRSRRRSPASHSSTPPRDRFQGPPRRRHSPSPPAPPRGQIVRSDGRQFRGSAAASMAETRQLTPSAAEPYQDVSPLGRRESRSDRREQRREKKKHKRRSRDGFQSADAIEDGSEEAKRDRRRSHKRNRHKELDYDEQDDAYADEPLQPELQRPNSIPRGRPAAVAIRPAQVQAAREAPEDSPRSDSLPSPPRIADLRKKYGMNSTPAAAELPSPAEIREPEPPISSDHARTAAAANNAAAPASTSGRPLPSEALPKATSKLPVQVLEAAQAVAQRAQEQQQRPARDPNQGWVQTDTPREYENSGPLAAPTRPGSGHHRQSRDESSQSEDGAAETKRQRKERRKKKKSRKEKRRHEGSSRKKEGSSRKRRRSSHRRSSRRSRSYSRSSSYSSRSRSRSRPRSDSRSRSYSRSRSPLNSPRAGYRSRSPVVPKRMRMDEELPRPQNIAAEINRAAEAARRAASRASVEVLKSACKVYVGGLPVGLKESDVKTLFADVMAATGFPATVMSAYLNQEKHFAFVEFTNPEAATRALQLDNLTCQGAVLKVRRPHDYKPEPGPPTPPAPVAAMPPAAPAKPLFPVQPDVAARPAAAPTASAPVAPAPPQPVPLPYAPAQAVSRPDPRPLEPPAALPRPPPVAKRARVLRLANMVVRDELLEEEEYADILDDITEEVERKYGKLRGIEVPRPRATGADPPGVGLVFLAFVDEAGAAKAQAALDGRKFGENTVVSSFFEEALFERRMFA